MKQSNNCSKSIKALVRSAVVRASDTPEKLRPGDAWRVYDAAHELGVVAEVKQLLREVNPPAFAAYCEYEADEITGNLHSIP